MRRVNLYDPSIPQEEIEQQRHQDFNRLSPEKKMRRLFALIDLSVKLNGGRPLKIPQGKGIVISRKNA